MVGRESGERERSCRVNDKIVSRAVLVAAFHASERSSRDQQLTLNASAQAGMLLVFFGSAREAFAHCPATEAFDRCRWLLQSLMHAEGTKRSA